MIGRVILGERIQEKSSQRCSLLGCDTLRQSQPAVHIRQMLAIYDALRVSLT